MKINKNLIAEIIVVILISFSINRSVNAAVFSDDIKQAAMQIDEFDITIESKVQAKDNASKETTEENDFLFDDQLDFVDETEEINETEESCETEYQGYIYPEVENDCDHIWGDGRDDKGDYFECKLCGYVEYYYIIPEHECVFEDIDCFEEDGKEMHMYECPICGTGYIAE